MGSLVLLGAAYGVIEEGLMVASFQNPHWMDLGVLATFGRVWGINLVWVVELTAYHSFVSIIIPIILVEQVYPERKDDSWLSGRWRKIVPALFTLDVIVGFTLFAIIGDFWSPLPQYLLFIVVTFMLIIAAHRLPNNWARWGTAEIASPRRITTISFVSALICALTFGVLPNILPNSTFFLVILVGLVIIVLTLHKLTSYNWFESRANHWLALAAGPLLLLILLSGIQEFDDKRVDDTSGMLLVGLFFLISLIIMWYRNSRTV